MLRALLLTSFCLVVATVVAAQTAAQKIVDAEHAFAAMAAEKGNPEAFVAYMTDDAWAFVPQATLAKPFWSGRKKNDALLSWAPNFADAASDGSFGYDTGNWEYRAKGKDDTPSAFGDFNTIWVRQPDGQYKWLVDIGVGHGKPAAYSTNWTTTKTSKTSKSKSITGTMGEFDAVVGKEGAEKAYAKYAAGDIRMFREDAMPIIGVAVKPALGGVLTFGPNTVSKTSSDMAFVLRPYTLTKTDKTTEAGNQLQVWKYRDGKWRIVLDVLKSVPAK
jgi:ketosteroid isomerase-like protein